MSLADLAKTSPSLGKILRSVSAEPDFGRMAQRLGESVPSLPVPRVPQNQQDTAAGALSDEDVSYLEQLTVPPVLALPPPSAPSATAGLPHLQGQVRGADCENEEHFGSPELPEDEATEPEMGGQAVRGNRPAIGQAVAASEDGGVLSSRSAQADVMSGGDETPPQSYESTHLSPGIAIWGLLEQKGVAVTPDSPADQRALAERAKESLKATISRGGSTDKWLLAKEIGALALRRSLYSPPNRGPVHNERPVSFDLRPKPRQAATEVDNRARMLACTGTTVCTTADDGLRVWDLAYAMQRGCDGGANPAGEEDAAEVAVVAVRAPRMLCLQVDMERGNLYSGHADGVVRVWRLQESQGGRTSVAPTGLEWLAHRHAVNAIAVTSYGTGDPCPCITSCRASKPLAGLI